MLKTFWDLVLALYDNEKELVTLAREKGYLLPKPTIIIALVIAILYLLSPYDIISEAIIPKSFLGYIDDIIVCIIFGGYIYTDVKEMLNFEQIQIPNKHVPEDKQSDGENSIHSSERHDDNSTDSSTSTNSNINSDREILWDNTIRDTGDTGNNTSIDGVDIEDCNEYSKPQRPGGWKNEL